MCVVPQATRVVKAEYPEIELSHMQVLPRSAGAHTHADPRSRPLSPLSNRTQQHTFLGDIAVAAQAKALRDFQQKYHNGAYAELIIEPKTIEQLRNFSKQNVAVFGYMCYQVMEDLLGSFTVPACDLLPLFIEVCITFSNITKTTKQVNSGRGMTVSSEKGSTHGVIPHVPRHHVQRN